MKSYSSRLLMFFFMFFVFLPASAQPKNSGFGVGECTVKMLQELSQAEFFFAESITCQGTSKILGDFSVTVSRPYSLLEMCEHLVSSKVAAGGHQLDLSIADEKLTFKNALFTHAGELAIFSPDWEVNQRPKTQARLQISDGSFRQFEIDYELTYSTLPDAIRQELNLDRANGTIAFRSAEKNKPFLFERIRKLSSCEAVF